MSEVANGHGYLEIVGIRENEHKVEKLRCHVQMSSNCDALYRCSSASGAMSQACKLQVRTRILAMMRQFSLTFRCLMLTEYRGKASCLVSSHSLFRRNWTVILGSKDVPKVRTAGCGATPSQGHRPRAIHAMTTCHDVHVCRCPRVAQRTCNAKMAPLLP